MTSSKKYKLQTTLNSDNWGKVIAEVRRDFKYGEQLLRSLNLQNHAELRVEVLRETHLACCKMQTMNPQNRGRAVTEWSRALKRANRSVSTKVNYEFNLLLTMLRGLMPQSKQAKLLLDELTKAIPSS